MWFSNLIRGLIIVFSAAVVPSIQFVKDSAFGDSELGIAVAHFIIENSLIISICVAFLGSSIGVISLIDMPARYRNYMLNAIMDGIYENILNNNKNDARISVFRDARLFRRNWYRFLDFFGLWKRKKDRNMTFTSIVKYCWKAEYIYLNGRWGTLHKKSRTHFHFSTETPSNCQGLAGQIRQRQLELVLNLPDISKLDLSDPAAPSFPEVVEYMKNGYISHFSNLRSLNCLMPYLYGNILTIRGGKEKIVLIVDAFHYFQIFKPPTGGRKNTHRIAMNRYIKQISAAYGV